MISDGKKMKTHNYYSYKMNKLRFSFKISVLRNIPRSKYSYLKYQKYIFTNK